MSPMPSAAPPSCPQRAGARRERPGHQSISEALPIGTPNVRLSSPDVSVREGPRQLTHNCRLELVVVILRSTDLHLHKGTRDASSGFGEMTGPQNLGPQEPSVRLLPPLPLRTPPCAELENSTWVGSRFLITGEVLHPPGTDTPTASLLWTRKWVSGVRAESQGPQG